MFALIVDTFNRSAVYKEATLGPVSMTAACKINSRDPLHVQKILTITHQMPIRKMQCSNLLRRYIV